MPRLQVDRGLNSTRLRQVGSLIGWLHGVSAQFVAAGRVQTLREAVPLDLPRWAAGTRPGSERLSAAHRRVLQAAASRLLPLLAGAAPRCFIHGDLHLWNLLFHCGEAGAIDFTNCGWGDPAMELASTLQYLQLPLAGNHDHRGTYPGLRDAVLDGSRTSTRRTAAWPGAWTCSSRHDCSSRWNGCSTTGPTCATAPGGPGFLRGQQQALRHRMGPAQPRRRTTTSMSSAGVKPNTCA